MEIKSIVEAILFSTPRPLSIETLAKRLKFKKKEEIKRAIEELKEEYENQGRAIEIIELPKGYIMRTKVEFANYVRLFRRKKERSLSRPLLETLAIVAFRQPVTKREIDELRGIDSKRAIKELLEKNLIKIDGRKDGEISFKTTDRFLLLYGLKSLEDLPTIREFETL